MKISLNWIKKYTGELNFSVNEIAEKIRSSLTEVENTEDLVEKYRDIIIAEIVHKEEHPNADKLGIYKINTGTRNDIQVVAGDKKLEIGDKIVYLPINTKIPNNPYPNKFDGIIKKAKLRGVESEGMLASEKELGISNNHDNVLVLDKNFTVGDDFAKSVGLNDYILELEKKPLTIRPDTFGIIGMSREIAGMLNKPFQTPDWIKNPQKPKTLKEEELPIKIINKLENLCPRYMAITMKEVKIKESPLWLKALLSSVDVKPINNVVDISNYLMVLTGQPLHTFDYDKLVSKDLHAENKAIITVRVAKQGEKITTLDSKTVNLTDKSVVICDSQNPIAVGGIMGGLDTEIDENTKNIIIESANFDLYNIRKTSMELGIFTEAATRFSKGQDPNLCEPVLYKAIEMIEELCLGKIASNVKDEHTLLPKAHKLTFSVARLNKHIGLNLTREKILNILSNVELFELNQEDEDLITLQIPSSRQDLKIPEEIHEEVARLYGYENIEITIPKKDIRPPAVNQKIENDKKIRVILKALGCNEVLTYNFIGENLYNQCDLKLENNYRITKPISPDLEYMRSSLIPSLVEKINPNINNGYDDFAIFEINKTHNKINIEQGTKLPKEHSMLTLVYAKNTQDPYYNAKNILDKLAKQLKTKKIIYESINKINNEKLPETIKLILPSFDINKTAIVLSELNKEKVYLGIIGEPNIDLQKNLKLKQPIGMFEINLENLNKIIGLNTPIINYSKFPKIQQDFCFILDKDIPYIILEQAVEKALDNRDINYTIKPLDIYQKEEKEKQITVSITIQHQSKTLKEKDIVSIRKLIEKKVFKDTKGKLKSTEK